jgi:hypothetical protein
MRTSLSTLLASALVLGVVTVANANEVLTLSDAQLDTVTAGGLYLVTYVDPFGGYSYSYSAILNGLQAKQLRADPCNCYTVTHLNR